ncbi:MAG TPA: glucose-6-phosphate dehydrogenase [Nitrospirales bacterium]|nr:glucose-6-phosphate dehydrogenase [Nitrospirales bacterium]
MPSHTQIVIFGASGDLTQRKLLPALYALSCENLLTDDVTIVGFARKEKSHEQFRTELGEAIGQHSRFKAEAGESGKYHWATFAGRVYYHKGDFVNADDYTALLKFLDSLTSENTGPSNRLFYLATPPSVFQVIIRRLGEAALVTKNATGDGWTRIIVEKPFGQDFETAGTLNNSIGAVFNEDQIYRIDHYLGKETVQNILVFRMSNGIFEPLWNNHYIDHVQITVAEQLGVEGRGGYFEEAGILRDMIQSHVLQLLTLIAMEPPAAFEANAIRDEKVKVLHAIRPYSQSDVNEHVVRAQYGAGHINGDDVVGYRKEPGVNAKSTTDSFVAMRLDIDNWRWAGVPFYLRVGKRLAKRVTEVAIYFKQAPYALFRSAGCHTLEPNVLALRIQPNEGISLGFGSKAPGTAIQIDPVQMDFLYETSFQDAQPEAYERLLFDCLIGDSTLFARRDEIEHAWDLVTRILNAWNAIPRPQIPQYQSGSWGPDESDDLIRKDLRKWRKL